MKDEHTTAGGFSTIELMVALALFVVVLSAVVLLSFGNQSIVVATQQNNEALSKAQELLEESQSLARKDFRLVNPVAEIGDGVYRKRLDVATQADYLTKKITATVTWSGEQGQPEHVELTALVTNFEQAVGGDTCDSVVTGDWNNPQVKNASTNFASLISDTGTDYTVTDADAYRNRLYVTTNAHSPVKENFFIFDVHDPAHPALVGKVDNTPSISEGFSAVATDGQYAYLASDYAADYSSCVEGYDCAQLQVADVRNPNTPTMIARLKLPQAGGAPATAQSIFYKDGYVYLGLEATGNGSWPEFYVIDVHTPNAPAVIGTYATGQTITNMYVRGKYAYVTVAARGGSPAQLLILDIQSNPSSPTLVSSYAAPDNQGDGTSLFTVGDILYLSRTSTPDNTEIYLLDKADPSHIASTPIATASVGGSVYGVIARSSHVLAVTTSRLEVRSSSNLSLTTAFVSLPASGGATTPRLECEGNVMYVTSNDSGNRGALSVIYP